MKRVVEVCGRCLSKPTTKGGIFCDECREILRKKVVKVRV